MPETIGSIAYLSLNGKTLKERLVAGYVVTCAGDPAAFTYKRSRRGDSLADRAAENVLARRFSGDSRIVDFFPSGSDERQYCSPGFDLPVGSIMRSMYGTFEEYHTSLDNRDFISFEAIQESVDVYYEVCRSLDVNVKYRNLVMHGEPQLGKRGLYPTIGAPREHEESIRAMMWLLNQADGNHDLLAVAERSGMDLFLLDEMARKCLEKGVVGLL